MAPRIIVYTTTWCRHCRAAKQFLDARGIPCEEVDIGRTPDAAEIVMRLSDGMRKVPTLEVEGSIVSGDRFDAARFEKDRRLGGGFRNVPDSGTGGLPG